MSDCKDCKDVELQMGDIVKIVDGSYAVCMSENNNYWGGIGHSQIEFEVIHTNFCSNHLELNLGTIERPKIFTVHNIIIRETGVLFPKTYLHSSHMVRKVDKVCTCCGQKLTNAEFK